MCRSLLLSFLLLQSMCIKHLFKGLEWWCPPITDTGLGAGKEDVPLIRMRHPGGEKLE